MYCKPDLATELRSERPMLLDYVEQIGGKTTTEICQAIFPQHRLHWCTSALLELKLLKRQSDVIARPHIAASVSSRSVVYRTASFVFHASNFTDGSFRPMS